MTERENIRETLLRPWMDFQWARRDYNNLAHGDYYAPNSRVEAYEKMMELWRRWEVALIEQFGFKYLVEYEYTRDDLPIVSETRSAIVMGIIYMPEF